MANPKPSPQTAVWDNIHSEDIGAVYNDTKGDLFFRCFQQPTLWKTIGVVKGLTVLDLACGPGGDARVAKMRGAREVTGVDISSKMVATAEQEEKTNPLGITYKIADAIGYKHDAQVDLVMSSYLLNNASDEAQLEAMCVSLCEVLCPGGRFVGTNLKFPADGQPFMKKSNMFTSEFVWDGPVSDGSMFTVNSVTESGESYSYSSYCWFHETVENALRKAGFSSIEWIKLQFSGEDSKTDRNRATIAEVEQMTNRIILAVK